MRRLLLLLLCLVAISAHGSIASTQIQTGCATIATGGTCAFASPVGAGHMIFISLVNCVGCALTSVAMTGETFTVPANCHNSSSLGSADCAYTLSAAGSQTTATFNFTGGNTQCKPVMYELSSTIGFAVDNIPTPVADSSTTTPAGVTFTLSGTNDAMFQWMICGGACTSTYSTSNGYTMDLLTASGNIAGGHLYNSTTTSGPIASQSPASTAEAFGAAFKEQAASTAKPVDKRRKLEATDPS